MIQSLHLKSHTVVGTTFGLKLTSIKKYVLYMNECQTEYEPPLSQSNLRIGTYCITDTNLRWTKLRTTSVDGLSELFTW